MDDQEKLKIGIGDKEPKKLTEAKVVIQGVRIDPVGAKKLEKVVFICRHPEKEEPIELSKVKIEQKDKLKFVGTWYSLDEDGKIQKGTAIAEILRFLGASNLDETTGKEIETAMDSDGYLCLKAYK